MKLSARFMIACCCIMLVACSKSDWRADAIADAEGQIGTQLDAPSAHFTRVQLTGNSSTGQTCGFVTAKSVSAPEKTTRFIVYIDGTAGPYIEFRMDAQAFETAWQNDCRREGYDS